MTDELRSLIAYRLQEAEDSIDEARVLLREGMSKRAVMNRLYYSMFHAVEQSEITQTDIDEILPVAVEFVKEAKKHLLGD